MGLVLLLAGCGAPASPGGGAGSPATGSASSGSGAATTTASPLTTGTVTPPASVPATIPSDWKTFTTSDGLSFDYPPDWTARDPGGDLEGAFVDVTNAAGKPMAELRTNIVTGAECVEQYPYQVYDAQDLPALAQQGAADRGVPRYVFESRGDGTGVDAARTTTAAYGITMLPAETGALACPMFHLFLWPPSGALFGSTYDPANNSTPGAVSLPYLEKAKLYAGTEEYRAIRTMITSLRPAKAAG